MEPELGLETGLPAHILIMVRPTPCPSSGNWIVMRVVLGGVPMKENSRLDRLALH